MFLEVRPLCNVDFCAGGASALLGAGHSESEWRALGHMIRWVAAVTFFSHGHGWWWNETQPQEPTPLGPWRAWMRTTIPRVEAGLHHLEETAEGVYHGHFKVGLRPAVALRCRGWVPRLGGVRHSMDRCSKWVPPLAPTGRAPGFVSLRLGGLLPDRHGRDRIAQGTSCGSFVAS